MYEAHLALLFLAENNLCNLKKRTLQLGPVNSDLDSDETPATYSPDLIEGTIVIDLDHDQAYLPHLEDTHVSGFPRKLLI